MRDIYYRYYRGKAFFIKDEEIVKRSINGRVLINIVFFRKINLNYARPKVDGSSLAVYHLSIFNDSSSIESLEKVYTADLDQNKLSDSDLLYYYLTISGFSFSEKL